MQASELYKVIGLGVYLQLFQQECVNLIQPRVNAAIASLSLLNSHAGPHKHDEVLADLSLQLAIERREEEVCCSSCKNLKSAFQMVVL